MKRCLIIAVALLMLLSVSACGKKDTPKKKSAAPTDAPYIDTQINEPEWTYAEGDLQLRDSETVYAEGEQILYFAIVTEADGSQELRFRLSDEAAAQLKTQSAGISYYMTHNGDKLGAATLNEDCTEATISQSDATAEITVLASKIRGLA